MQQQTEKQAEQSYVPLLTHRLTSDASMTAQIVNYNYLQPAWCRTKPWLTWTANQCGAAAVFTIEKTCDYAPVVADGVLRGSASACRKTKRAATATQALLSDYWYGGASHPDVLAEKTPIEKSFGESSEDESDCADDCSEGESCDTPELLPMPDVEAIDNKNVV